MQGRSTEEGERAPASAMDQAALDSSEDTSQDPDLPATDTTAPASGASTQALALRTPAALSNQPSFFPDGHAQPHALAAVLLAGPGLALTAGTVGAVLGGPGLATLLALGTYPVGQFGAHWWFQSRGRRQLAEALALRPRDRVAADAQLDQIVHSPRCLPEVRVEAAGWLALDDLERGDLAAAVARLDFDEGDRSLVRRRRNWEVGCRGEVLRAILAWLSPGSFTEIGIASAGSFPEPRDSEDGRALLAALRLVESAGKPDDGVVASAWADVEGTSLGQLSPTLRLICRALGSERLPELVGDLHEELRNDPDGRKRALLRRLFPRMTLPGDAGYRGVSQDLAEVDEQPPADLSAPDEITALARVPDAALAPVSRAPVALIFAGIYGTIFGAGVLLGAAAGGAVGAVAGGALSLLMGVYAAPIPILLGSRAVEERERLRRIAPLLSLQPRLPRSWLTEIACGPPGRVERSSGYRRLQPIPRSQMILHIAVARAEHALYRGELEEAWAQVEWWFAGAAGRLPSIDPMYAAGASLLRVATLTGHFAAAERLSGLLEPLDHPWDDLARRTAYGNASRALALARALLAARRGSLEMTASHLEWAHRHRTVYIAAHDQTLYAELVARCARRGLAVPTLGLRPRPEYQAWVDQLLPE